MPHIQPFQFLFDDLGSLTRSSSFLSFLRFSSFRFWVSLRNSSSSKLKSDEDSLISFPAKLESVSDIPTLTSSPGSTPSSPVISNKRSRFLHPMLIIPSHRLSKPRYHPSLQEFYRYRVKQSVPRLFAS